MDKTGFNIKQRIKQGQNALGDSFRSTTDHGTNMKILSEIKVRFFLKFQLLTHSKELKIMPVKL